MPKVLTDIQDTILNSAEELLQTRGFNQLEMRDIAAHAHIAVGTIYHYYKNKDALFLHVMANGWQQTLAQMEALSMQEVEPDQALRALIQHLVLGMRKRLAMRNLWTEIAALYNDVHPGEPNPLGFSGMHPRMSACFGRVLARKVAHVLTPAEQKQMDRLGCFAFVMAVDLCMLEEPEATPHQQLLIDLLTTYIQKEAFGLEPPGSIPAMA